MARKRYARLSLEPLEDRFLLASINWIGAGQNGNWSNAANWAANGRLPGKDDTAVFSDANLTGKQTTALVDNAFNPQGRLEAVVKLVGDDQAQQSLHGNE